MPPTPLDDDKHALCARFENNNFVMHSHQIPLATAVYPAASRAQNHSCAPSAVPLFLFAPATPPRMEDVLVRDVLAGDGIMIPYIDPVLAPSARRERLRASYGFQCPCVQCISPSGIEAQIPDLAERFTNAAFDAAVVHGEELLALYRAVYPPFYPLIGPHLAELAKTAWNAALQAGAAAEEATCMQWAMERVREALERSADSHSRSDAHALWREQLRQPAQLLAWVRRIAFVADYAEHVLGAMLIGVTVSGESASSTYDAQLATVYGQHGLEMPIHVVGVSLPTLFPPNQNDPHAKKMSAARRNTRQSSSIPPNTSTGPGRQQHPQARGRGAPPQNQQPLPGQNIPPRLHRPATGYGGHMPPVNQNPPYAFGTHSSPLQGYYPQQGVYPLMQNFTDYDGEYGDYGDDDVDEEGPRGGPNNDQWPLSVFEPNNTEEPAPPSNDPSASEAPNPDDAPLRRMTRGAEPTITNTEFRDLVPSTSRQVTLSVASDATRPAQERMESVPVNLPSTPVRRTETNTTTSAVSPYNRILNPNDKSKPRLNDQSPPSTTLARAAGFRYRRHIVTQNAFPTRDESDKLISQMVADSSVAVKKGESRLKRYKAEKSYQHDVDKLIRRLGTQVRGSLVKCCRDNCGTVFKLIGLPKAKIIIIVTELLETKAYHFRELKRETEVVNGVEVEKVDGKIISRQGAYRNTLVEYCIRMEYCQNHERMATNEDAGNSFNPVPNEVIALVATAISCALAEWRTGVHLVGKTEFKAHNFKGTYEEHLAALEAMTAEAPDANLAWCSYLFDRCSTGLLNNDPTGTALPVTLTRTELSDYSDIPAAV
ncbi:hypothetical protein AURDEDRAFT_176369 [Auricularia subglabra TFB-10046 SS5]|uniref:DUF6532 domain-containing protein n=1 Tax=Auricularia subglabra (strain TFB-10046 / SS5) TaxID=717982 RepID=J0WRK5_AURST|nr:hypothetical protein AURDEDRAFT_176369 [Auricularia subglabra TFB-10046 SS5]